MKLIGGKLGTGAYGNVEALEFGGIICAGKRIHDALIDFSDEGWLEFVTLHYIQSLGGASKLFLPKIMSL